MYQMDTVEVSTHALPQGEVSFEDFFLREHRRLLRALYVITGDQGLAEDAAEDAFVKVLEKWERVRVMEEPVGYLYTTALNAVRSYHRRIKRSLSRETPLASRDPMNGVEEHEIILRALARLTHRQRSAIVLTVMLGYDSESAGQLLDVRPVTVRRLASQARAALRNIFADIGWEDWNDA